MGQPYIDVLRDQLGSERAPDTVLVAVRDQDASVEAENPYWRAKAFLLAQGVPSQEVRLSVVRTRPSQLPCILENIAVAIYAKLGGSPWTIRPTLPLKKEVVIGMAHAQFGGRYSPLRRIMGITAVFSSDGTYLLAAGSQRCEYENALASSTRFHRIPPVGSDRGGTGIQRVGAPRAGAAGRPGPRHGSYALGSDRRERVAAPATDRAPAAGTAPALSNGRARGVRSARATRTRLGVSDADRAAGHDASVAPRDVATIVGGEVSSAYPPGEDSAGDDRHHPSMASRNSLQSGSGASF